VQIKDLTVVVPTRNEAQNAAAFLASLPEDVALIVVDSSDDDTPELVTRLRPTRTQVFRVSANVTEARQLGAAATSTPWLLYTDADVVFAPEYFVRLLAYNAFDVIYGPKLSMDGYAAYYRLFAAGQRTFHCLGIPAASGSNLLVRRECLEAVGGFDLALPCNEDSELAWRMKRAGFRVEFALDLVVYARDHRRLDQGVARKTVHSLARCTLLYLGILPPRWRGHDWGYFTRMRDRQSRGPGGTISLSAR
jgi:glycosyltransferase involved in cell wall biosynthesis